MRAGDEGDRTCLAPDDESMARCGRPSTKWSSGAALGSQEVQTRGNARGPRPLGTTKRFMVENPGRRARVGLKSQATGLLHACTRDGSGINHADVKCRMETLHARVINGPILNSHLGSMQG
jgi:hypothetical protein